MALESLSAKQHEELGSALISSFYNKFEMERFARSALSVELDNLVGNVGLQVAADELIKWAGSRGMLEQLMRTAELRRPGNASLKKFMAGLALPPSPFANVRGVAAGGEGYEAVVLKASGFENPDTWRARMMESERRVCQVLFGKSANGTGYLVGPDIVLTNHHVLDPYWNGLYDWKDLSFKFDYRSNGVEPPAWEGVLAAVAGTAPLASSPKAELDFALIRLAAPVGESPIGPNGPKRGWLTPHLYDFSVGEALLILQHPRGRTIELAIGSVTKADEQTRIEHTASTENGSSGSPCFSTGWKLVAMHHWGKEAVTNRAIKAKAFHPSIVQHLPGN